MWQSYKIKSNTSTGELKDIGGSPHTEEQCDIHSEERKYVSGSLWLLRKSQINTRGTIPQQKKTEISKGQTGKPIY